MEMPLCSSAVFGVSACSLIPVGFGSVKIVDHPEGIPLLRKLIESSDDTCKRYSAFTM
jgi:hypothetical protein